MKKEVPIFILSCVLLFASLVQSGCGHSSKDLVFKQNQQFYVIDKESSAVSIYSDEGKLSHLIGIPAAGPEQERKTIPDVIIRYLLTGKGSISGLIWEDLNNNKSYDTGEPGVQNVRVFIDNDNDNKYSSYDTAVFSDINGLYTFQKVRPGKNNVYIDKGTLPNGYEIITNHPFSVILSRSETFTGADVGLQNRSGFISGTVWDQTDNAPISNGKVFVDLDLDEVYMPGEPFSLTSSTGDYQITNLAGGTYDVQVDVGSIDIKFHQVTVSGLKKKTVTLTPGGNQTVNFAYVHKSSINGYVRNANGDTWGYLKLFIDLNGNGLYDAGEPVTWSDAYGYYTFNNLLPGSYMILMFPDQLPEGYEIISASEKIVIDEGENYSLDFSTQSQPVTITGFVWNDENGNRVRETDESGLANISVFLDANNNGTFESGETSGVTDSNGAFAMSGLENGDFFIRVDVSSLLIEYNPTTPIHLFKNIGPGKSYDEATFGFQSKLTPMNSVNYPTRLNWGSDGKLYVSDNVVGSVFIYNSDLNMTGELKKLGKPLGIISDDAGNVYVGNEESGNVEVYDPMGNLLKSIGDGGIHTPNDIAFDNDQNIYILDSSQDTVLIYDSAGNSTGRRIGDSSIIDYAVSIAINYRNDGTGNVGELYVADQPNCVIHVYDLDGSHKKSVGSCGNLMVSNWDGKFSGLVAVDIDKYGNIHGLDNNLNVVQVFDPQSGSFVSSYNAYPTDNEFLLNLQTDLDINPNDGRVIISNASTKSVELVHTVP